MKTLFNKRKTLGSDGLYHAPWGHVDYWCGAEESAGFVMTALSFTQAVKVEGVATCLRCLVRMERADLESWRDAYDT
jgi:hypothetical protein